MALKVLDESSVDARHLGGRDENPGTVSDALAAFCEGPQGLVLARWSAHQLLEAVDLALEPWLARCVVVLRAQVLELGGAAKGEGGAKDWGCRGSGAPGCCPGAL